MCGFVGAIDFSHSISLSDIEKANHKIFHRGPDSGRSEQLTSGKHNIYFAHRRLSIIDLSNNASQPFTEDKYSIIFNGEIYNYNEVRCILKSSGITFKTNSDTEVLLKAYIYWGTSCVEKLKGMFSFVIYDSNNEEIVYCRDRLGVKPLFIFQNNDQLILASELKSIKSLKQNLTMNLSSANYYHMYGYTPRDQSIYSEIKKVTPGTISKFSLKTKKTITEKYWDAESFYQHDSVSNFDLNKIEDLIVNSCKLRLVSDVPVGVFLSGGIDSSLVTAICKNLNPEIQTFTIGFKDPKFDESKHAQLIAKHLGTKHHSFTCTEKDAIEISKNITQTFDEPFADSSAIPTMLLSKLTKNHIKVALSADGGDEIFLGYKRYEQLVKLRRYKILFKFFNSTPGLTKAVKKFINPYNFDERMEKINLIIKSQESLQELNNIEKYFSDTQFSNLVLDNKYDERNLTSNQIDALNTYSLMDLKYYLTDDIMVKVDRASMRYGIEAREPLLDNTIIEYMSKVSGKAKYDGELKSILKQITYKYIPKHLIDRPKKGFSVPIKDWMTTIFKEEFLDLTNSSTIKLQGYYNPIEIEKIRTALLHNENINYQTLWIILMFQRWNEESSIN